MKFKILILIFLMLLIPGLTSCDENKIHIDLYLYDQEDTFIASIADKLKNTFDSRYEIITYDSKRSQIIQNGQIINSLESKDKPDFLIINLVDRLSCNSIIEKAQSYDVPMIFFNREPLKKDLQDVKNAYYVGTNPTLEGESQGKFAEDLFRKNPNIDKNNDGKLQCVFLKGEQSHQDTEERTNGVIDYLNSVGIELDILDMAYADWNRKKGYAEMKKMYNSFSDEIEFVFSNNDDMALGAIDYLMEIQKEDKTYTNGTKLPFPIVGVDGTKDGLKAIEDGYLYGTILNDVNKQARTILGLVYLIQGKITVDQFKNNYEVNIAYNRYIYVTGEIRTQKLMSLRTI